MSILLELSSIVSSLLQSLSVPLRGYLESNNCEGRIRQRIVRYSHRHVIIAAGVSPRASIYETEP
jgi:hypothetical protein